MILLDTNVVSEALRPAPDAKVLSWLDEQLCDALYLSAITVAELRLGTAVLPDGRKRDLLADRLENRIFPLFEGRILAFDEPAAAVYAQIRSTARKQGKAVAAADGYIAATAKLHRMVVATRDVSPFRAAGVKVVNPWSD
ncbi:TPA: type II toxin-antitoxin system VapC family toxin [Neisseria bacilliformis]